MNLPQETGNPSQAGAPGVPHGLDMLLDLELRLSVSFGRTQLPLREILKLSSGSLIELNCSADELVEVIVNGRTVARGEVVVVDGNYGVRIHEIVSRRERIVVEPGQVNDGPAEEPEVSQ